MSDAPKWPGNEEEQALPEGQGPGQPPPRWETVTGPGAQQTPAAAPVVLPPPSVSAGVPPPPSAYPPEPAAGGYQPVYGGSPASGPAPAGSYGAPVYGSQPQGYPPPAAGPGYGPPMPPPAGGGYQQQFPQQGNYGVNVAEALAMGLLVTRARRRRRHLILWPLLLVLFLGFLLLRGCLGVIHMVADAGKPQVMMAAAEEPHVRLGCV